MLDAPSLDVTCPDGGLPVPVIDLPFLARKINDAHRQVAFHARSMLDEARRAGEALIEAKKLVPHGGWKDWIAANCRCSYRTAAKYAQLASIKHAEVGTFDGGVDAFLDAHASRCLPTPADASRPAFDRADAEHAQKLQAMAERGSTPAERDVAKRKLESFAEGFGMTGAEAVEKAAEMAPEVVAKAPLDAAFDKFVAIYDRHPKHRLVSALIRCFLTHPELVAVVDAELQK